jgi:hypothetical protein
MKNTAMLEISWLLSQDSAIRVGSKHGIGELACGGSGSRLGT